MIIDKDLDLIAEAYKKVLNEEERPSALERAESVYGEENPEVGVSDEESASYEESKEELLHVGNKIVHCLYNSPQNACEEADVQEDSSSAEKCIIHVVYEGKGYTLTVEQAKY